MDKNSTEKNCFCFIFFWADLEWGLCMEYNNEILERMAIKNNWSDENRETILGNSYCYWQGKFGNIPDPENAAEFPVKNGKFSGKTFWV